MFPDKNLPVEPPSSASHAQAQAQSAGDSRTHRAPVSGTMARVIPREAETLAELPSLATDNEPEEEATRVSSPLRSVANIDDEELTCQYHDLPTRVMHPPEDAIDAPPMSSRRPEPSAPRPLPSHGRIAPAPVSVRGRSLLTEVVATGTAQAQAGDTAISQPPHAPPPPTSVVQPIASVVVNEQANVSANANATPMPIDRQGPLELERALLRALTATAPRLVMPPVVAIRAAPPSPRMLAIVATFTMLGLMWVMAVCAMILVLVTR